MGEEKILPIFSKSPAFKFVNIKILTKETARIYAVSLSISRSNQGGLQRVR
jgi:hypothetical protein